MDLVYIGNLFRVTHWTDEHDRDARGFRATDAIVGTVWAEEEENGLSDWDIIR